MTNEEAKQALLSHETVGYSGGKYILSAIVYKCIDGRIATSAELIPINGANSLTVAKIRDINRRTQNDIHT